MVGNVQPPTAQQQEERQAAQGNAEHVGPEAAPEGAQCSGAVRAADNGHLPERTIGVGMGAVAVNLPRVSEAPR